MPHRSQAQRPAGGEAARRNRDVRWVLEKLSHRLIHLKLLIGLIFRAVSSDIDLKATLEQNEKQKKQIAKLETERVQYKTRIKELTDEMSMMQGRELQGSDEDSPDQLSEIDRQQELMSNISMKNKHIKRLLRDIEVD